MSEEELLTPRNRQQPNTRMRLVLAGLGAMALAACAYLVATNVSPNATDTTATHMSARALLESDELAEAITDNIMKSGASVSAAMSREDVKATAARKLMDVSHQSHVHDPDGSAALDRVSFDTEQRDAALRVLRSLSDPRVQRLSLIVAHTVRDSASEDSSVIERRLSEALDPHKADIRELMEVISPDSLSEMAGKDWHPQLDSDRIKFMKTFGDGWDMQISARVPAAAPEGESRRLDAVAATSTMSPLYNANRAFSILRMIFDQCRVIIDIIRPAARLFGHDMHTNPWLTSAFGMADAVFAGVSCELDGMAHDMDTMKMASCPLQVASAASDALRWIFARYNMIKYPGDSNSTSSDTPASSLGDSKSSFMSSFADAFKSK